MVTVINSNEFIELLNHSVRAYLNNFMPESQDWVDIFCPYCDHNLVLEYDENMGLLGFTLSCSHCNWVAGSRYLDLRKLDSQDDTVFANHLGEFLISIKSWHDKRGYILTWEGWE